MGRVLGQPEPSVGASDEHSSEDEVNPIHCPRCHARLAPDGHWCAKLAYYGKVVACGSPEAVEAARALLDPWHRLRERKASAIDCAERAAGWVDTRKVSPAMSGQRKVCRSGAEESLREFEAIDLPVNGWTRERVEKIRAKLEAYDRWASTQEAT
jgi:hypothetical protein